jgi:hypothetical protein
MRPCKVPKWILVGGMTTEQIKAAAGKYGTAERINYLIQALGGRHVHQEDYSKALRYCGRNMICLSDTLQRLGYQYIQADTHRYIYALEACGYMYIGATKDPFARFVDHIISSQCSSVILIAAAIDNNLVPRMEVVDVTDEESSNGIEGFWIRYLSWKGYHVVNSMHNADELARFVKNGGGFRSVVANRLVGYSGATFPALLVSSTGVPMQELTKKFVPPWFAS